MAEQFLKDYPRLRKKILEHREPEIAADIPLESWESRIEPVIHELQNRNGFETFNCTFEGDEIRLMTNEDELSEFFAPMVRKLGFTPAPSLNLYVFSGFHDLPLLRRLKEFPDESTREELEDFWVGQCAENRSAIVLNRNR